MNRRNWKKRKCNLCGEKLRHDQDLILYNTEMYNGEMVISELEFRHQNISDKNRKLIGGCDDRSFTMSRHVFNNFEDLLDEWAKSPFNKH